MPWEKTGQPSIPGLKTAQTNTDSSINYFESIKTDLRNPPRLPYSAQFFRISSARQSMGHDS